MIFLRLYFMCDKKDTDDNIKVMSFSDCFNCDSLFYKRLDIMDANHYRRCLLKDNIINDKHKKKHTRLYLTAYRETFCNASTYMINNKTIFKEEYLKSFFEVFDLI